MSNETNNLVPLTHPKFDGKEGRTLVTEEVPKDDVTSWTDAGWVPEKKAGVSPTS